MEAITAIKTLLRRYDRYTGRLNVPGDWGERAFRGWLAMDLLCDALGWPSSHVVLGERFDILLLDQGLHPVVNIETKKPYYEASPREKANFEDRLKYYGTLRWACLTNGTSWLRLSLLSPSGTQVIQERKTLNIEKASQKAARSFFEVIHARNFLV